VTGDSSHTVWLQQARSYLRQADPVLARLIDERPDFDPENPVLTSQVVIETAARLGITPAQVALQWLLQLAPNVLLIPGTGSVAHLRENLAAEGVTFDDEALRQLDAVAPWPDDPSRAV
jgi:aryl-alcohol dehydrogenase-like predicted oxidoreductase